MLDGPFVGSEAMEGGLVRKHELRSLYRTVFPDVYVPKDAELTLHGSGSGGLAVVSSAGHHRRADRVGLARREMGRRSRTDRVDMAERPAGSGHTNLRLPAPHRGIRANGRYAHHDSCAHGIRYRPTKTPRRGDRQPRCTRQRDGISSCRSLSRREKASRIARAYASSPGCWTCMTPVPHRRRKPGCGSW